jgi:hypothetical protein
LTCDNRVSSGMLVPLGACAAAHNVGFAPGADSTWILYFQLPDAEVADRRARRKVTHAKIESVMMEGEGAFRGTTWAPLISIRDYIIASD